MKNKIIKMGFLKRKTKKNTKKIGLKKGELAESDGVGGEDYNEYHLLPKEKRDCGFVAVVLLFGTAYIFYQSVVLSALACLVTPFLLRQYAQYLAQRRKEVLLGQFKDLLYSLSASFAAGRHMREGLSEAYENLRLLYEEDSPMICELSNMLLRLNESRESEERILQDFARRSASKDIQNFIDIYFICRATGADLQKVILRASDMLMDKITIEKEIKVLTAQKRLEGKIISFMPVGVILFLSLVSPDYVEGLYTTFTGKFIMTTALVGIAYAYRMTISLSRIEV